MKYVVTVLFLLVINFTYAIENERSDSDDNRDGYALIAGKPVSVKLFRSISDTEGNTDNIVIGDIFRVKLKNVRPVRGEFQEKQVVVELMATYKESILSKDEIYVFLEIGADGNSRALGWAQPESVVCFPSELIKGKRIESEFQIRNEYTKKLCTNSRWYR